MRRPDTFRELAADALDGVRGGSRAAAAPSSNAQLQQMIQQLLRALEGK